jgi:LmbE family N-acetylglucosaminyl deacetylase
MPGGPIVFVHAHPDDEAIFTGGTMRLLADAGHEVVLVVATRGEGGAHPGGEVPLPEVREAETRRAAALLGVGRVEFLGYTDSGLTGMAAHDAFAAASVHEAAARLAPLLEAAACVVTYDDAGVYGHPDHVATHLVAHEAAERASVPVRYEVTVDHEYLHFVETHLVSDAAAALRDAVGDVDPLLHRPGDGPLGRPGLPTVLIDAIVDVRAVIGVKRAAMAAHASQLPEVSPSLQLADEVFAATYGYEWFTRAGPPGPIERLAAARA